MLLLTQIQFENILKRNAFRLKIVKISGSAEIAPALGVAPAIADLVATGSTMALNGLRIIEKISQSEAVLIVNLKTNKNKAKLVEKLTARIKTVLSAKNCKYLAFNVRRLDLIKLKKILPQVKMSSTNPSENSEWINIYIPVKEEILWEVVDRIKELGATGIVVLAIENLIS